ncbi:MAG: hypothetical protein OHK0046_01740 [Anaerolineae bacterium]
MLILFNRLVVLAALLLLSSASPAQLENVIGAHNIAHLQPVYTIDFAGLDADFVTGWFAMDASGDTLLVTTQDNTVLIFRHGDVIDTFPLPAQTTLIDASLTDTQAVIAGDNGTLIVRDLETQETTVRDTYPTIRALWLEGDTIWTEHDTITTEDGTAIAPAVVAHQAEESTVYPYAPAADAEALVRIGRIMPPYVVTASPEGAVKLWNLQADDVIAQAVVDNAPAVFGQINSAATHLIWRDPMSAALYLLDFTAEKNLQVVALNGNYVQYFLLSAAADLGFAVHVEDDPVLVAWNTETGRRYDLGDYRACSRLPDMARMSPDGTTLVIGCDLGLEVWRIVED